MSALRVERVETYNGHVGNTQSRTVCNCCPYGYHIDLGFVEFCDKLAKESSQSNPAKKERRERRRQTQSMEVLLGLTNPVFWNVQQLLPMLFLWKQKKKHVNKPANSKSENQISCERTITDDAAPIPPPRNSSLIGVCDSDALKKAVQDFEATLERTTRKTTNMKEFELLPADHDPSSHRTTATPTPSAPLKSIREQMAISLEKMRDLEDKVKTLSPLENQVIILKKENKRLLSEVKDLSEQLRTDRQKLEIRQGETRKCVALRDVAVHCSTITRDVGVTPMLPKVIDISTITDKPKTSEKASETDVAEQCDDKLRRISLKDLDNMEGVIGKVSKSVQVNSFKCSALEVIEKRDETVQTDKIPLKLTKDISILAKPKSVEVAVEAKPMLREKGVSNDSVNDIFCDRCANLKTRSIGVGLGSIWVPEPGLLNRSKSFTLTRKNTRTIGVSTVPILKKTMATKQVGTVEVTIPKSNTGVNTDTKKYRDTAVTVDLIKNSLCKDCTEKKELLKNDVNLLSKEQEVVKEDFHKDVKKDGNKKSKIPLLKPTTPVLGRKTLMRQNTYSKTIPIGVQSQMTVERLTSSSEPPEDIEEEKVEVTLRKKVPKPLVDSVTEAANRLSSDLNLSGNQDSLSLGDRFSGIFDECGFDYDEHYGEQESNRNSHMFSENALFQPIQEKQREKLVPSKEMKAAMKVVNDGLHKYPNGLPKHLKTASSIIQQEWFRISSTASANPLDVEDYLDSFEEVSNTLLEFVVNMVDNNGNTAMHYAVSHGNFDVVSILLDSKVCNINKPNAAGYTCVMLVSLAQVRSETHRQVVRRLFLLADVNVRAKQHGQTSLMLAVSHGRLDMVQLLLDAGADPNIQDCDGSTALMCAAEHGHLDIVKHILAHPDTDPYIVDCDGSSALAIAMEAGNRDIGVLLYAREHFAPNSRGSSPYTSLKQRRSRHSSSPHPKTPTSPGHVKHSDRSF